MKTIPDDPQKYLDPLTLAKVRSLELQARLVVEGYLSGMHKSPYHGFSVEFAQHREYVPGDDIKHVDWKVYGRTGRFYLKQYEEETNLAFWLLLSDLFDDPREILAGLKHLRYKRHEVVVFHIMDSAELDFPFQEATLFRGLEQLPELLTDPRALRDGYLEQVNGFISELRRGCRDQNMDYVQLRTDQDLSVALSSYLGHRLAR